MRIFSPSKWHPTARWSSQLLRVWSGLAAATIVAAAAPGLTASAGAELQAPETAPIAADAKAQTTIGLRGRLWLDCRGDGSYSAQDPPVRGAIVELVTSSGQLSTTVTDRAGAYAFPVVHGRPDAIVVPLIQTPLEGLAPSPTSTAHSVPGRSIGTRVADLDRVAVTAAGADKTTSRYDFGFIPASGDGRRSGRFSRCDERR